ncbi:serine/threonine-protein kinase [Amycolatopsis sp. NPDC057786]|uniref:serine/threonine-protein kinase n=1 Tax=Amycolatopsis sp. NPDC057786 TaxID=3346250 RepID=UPI003672F6FC
MTFSRRDREPARRRIADRYRLIERVGVGGEGVVWRAVDERTGRTVAAKQAKMSASGAGRKLRREARLAASVDHPHVVVCHEIVSDHDELWLIQEYVPSQTLAAVLSERALPEARVAEIGVQLASALAAVHERKILHRDLKPGNVLIAEDGRAKLTDFGISRSVAADETLTDAALYAGTPGYLAPEVARGDPPTAASDVFSLGATLYAALEGAPMFAGETPLAKVRRAADGDIPVSRAADRLADPLARMLDPDPALRPSAAEAGAALAACSGGTTGRTPERRGAVHRFRRPIGAAAGIAAVAVGTLSASTPTAPAAPAPAPFDARALDPCRLTDTATLRSYGTPELEPDYGNFNRCDVLLHRDGGSFTDVKVELKNHPGNPPEGELKRVGNFDVVAGLLQDDSCTRLILVPDGYLVSVTADDDPGAPVDLCAVADIATDSATKALSRNGPPLRKAKFPARSLAEVDACALLDPAAPEVPGPPRPFFGRWSCGYEGPAGRVRVIFDRGHPLDDEDGPRTTQAGREIRTLADDYGPGTCRSTVAYRPYTDIDNIPMLESVLIVVNGDGPSERLCAPATTLAGEVARRLP